MATLREFKPRAWDNARFAIPTYCNQFYTKIALAIFNRCFFCTTGTRE